MNYIIEVNNPNSIFREYINDFGYITKDESFAKKFSSKFEADTFAKSKKLTSFVVITVWF